MKLLLFKQRDLFETVRLSVSISLRNLFNSLNSIKEYDFTIYLFIVFIRAQIRTSQWPI